MFLLICSGNEWHIVGKGVQRDFQVVLELLPAHRSAAIRSNRWNVAVAHVPVQSAAHADEREDVEGARAGEEADVRLCE